MTDLPAVQLPVASGSGRWIGLRQLIAAHRSSLQNLSAIVIINFTAGGLGFLTKVKIANVLGKADFGLFAYGLALGTYAATLVNFGLQRTLVRDIIHHPDRTRGMIVSSLALRGLVLLAVLIGLLAWNIFSRDISRLAWGIVCIVLAQALVALDLRGVYDAWGCMTRHSLYFLVYRCLYFAAVWGVILFSSDNLSVLWLGLFMTTSVLLYLTFQYRWAFANIALTDWSTGLARSVLQVAKSNLVIWVSTLAVLSMSVLNQIFLKHFAGKERLGEYSAAWAFVTIAALCLQQIGRVGNPATARITQHQNDARARLRFLAKYICIMLLAACPISLAALAFPRTLLAILFKPEYSTAAGALRVLGLYVLVYAVGLVASQYVVSVRMERTYFLGVVMGSIASIVLSVALIPRFGPVGCAYAVLASDSLSILIYYVAVAADLRRCSQGRGKSLWERLPDGRPDATNGTYI